MLSIFFVLYSFIQMNKLVDIRVDNQYYNDILIVITIMWGYIMSDNKSGKLNELNPEVLERNEKLAIKYELLREKITHHYNRGSRMLKTIKIVATVIFIIFTAYGIVIGNHTGNKMFWLTMWVILIFTNAIVFLITDYCQYLIKDKVIPYLEDDDQLEFGEYSIFIEDLEETEDEEEEDEE